MIPPFQKTLPEAAIEERAEIFRPEDDSVNVIGRRRDCRNLSVVWIYDLECAIVDLPHEPVHVKGGNIASAGSGDDDFLKVTHVNSIIPICLINRPLTSFARQTQTRLRQGYAAAKTSIASRCRQCFCLKGLKLLSGECLSRRSLQAESDPPDKKYLLSACVCG